MMKQVIGAAIAVVDANGTGSETVVVVGEQLEYFIIGHWAIVDPYALPNPGGAGPWGFNPARNTCCWPCSKVVAAASKFMAAAYVC